MSAKQILTNPPPPDNQSRPKLGPLTHLTRTRALPRRHLQGGARHETRRCRPILAGFWAFTREGNEGGEGRTSAAPPGRKNGAKGVAAAGPDKPTKRFPVVPSLTTEHTSSPDPAHETQAAGDGQRESRRREPNLRSGEEGKTPRRSQPPPAAHHPRGRAIRPESPAAGASREDAAASPNRAAAPDPKTSAMDEASDASPPPSPASAGNIRARPSSGGQG